MTTLFISDLHLDEKRPDISEHFHTFLEAKATKAEALYILGDLFESWIGDDDPNTHYKKIKEALKKVVNSGVPIFFMHGNRDFLIGNQFAQETDIQLLKDPHIMKLYGFKILLSHGDIYCTNDQQYQQKREVTRSSKWKSEILQKTLKERRIIAEQARLESLEHNKIISEEISDVTHSEIEQAFQNSGVQIMIHGHTHRPKIHSLIVNNKNVKRVVLGDWYDQGSMVKFNENGPDLITLER